MSLLPSSPYLPDERLDVLERGRLERLEAVPLVHLADDVDDVFAAAHVGGQKIAGTACGLSGCHRG